MIKRFIPVIALEPIDPTSHAYRELAFTTQQCNKRLSYFSNWRIYKDGYTTKEGAERRLKQHVKNYEGSTLFLKNYKINCFIKEFTFDEPPLNIDTLNKIEKNINLKEKELEELKRKRDILKAKLKMD